MSNRLRIALLAVFCLAVAGLVACERGESPTLIPIETVEEDVAKRTRPTCEECLPNENVPYIDSQAKTVQLYRTSDGAALPSSFEVLMIPHEDIPGGVASRIGFCPDEHNPNCPQPCEAQWDVVITNNAGFTLVYKWKGTTYSLTPGTTNQHLFTARANCFGTVPFPMTDPNDVTIYVGDAIGTPFVFGCGPCDGGF